MGRPWAPPALSRLHSVVRRRLWALATVLGESLTLAKSCVRIELHLTEAGDRAEVEGAGMRFIDIIEPQMLVLFIICIEVVSPADQVCGAGNDGGRAIQAVCASILFENPCEEVQGVVVVCFLPSH